MVIKILGMGCANCKKLKEMAASVIQEMGFDAQVVEVNDLAAIMSYGVTSTPGLVIDEQVVGYGGVPTRAQLTSLIAQAAAQRQMRAATP